MLYVYTFFEGEKPISTGIRDGNKNIIIDLYKPGTGLTIKKIKQKYGIIRDIILNANSSGRPVIISDFKRHLDNFDFPKSYDQYNVYDLHLPANENIVETLNSMPDFELCDYHKLIANSAVVYSDLQREGLLLNYTKVFPIWSQDTFSGRSKSSGFNIQGYYQRDIIKPVSAPDKIIFIHFDWICADIRIASILSGDSVLNDSFLESDPYTFMMKDLGLTREECKSYLLKSINSMDFTSDAFRIYPQLGDWITNCVRKLSRDGELQTILGRKFSRRSARNDFAVLNGVMQGSVAHAMQRVIRRVWEQFPGRLIAEIHDSLVMCSDISSARSIIEAVSEIMLYPFDNDIIFPLKISIGKKWRNWQFCKEIRK